jgi:hypothetical protein
MAPDVRKAGMSVLVADIFRGFIVFLLQVVFLSAKAENWHETRHGLARNF